jgi:hypothetical protein
MKKKCHRENHAAHEFTHPKSSQKESEKPTIDNSRGLWRSSRSYPEDYPGENGQYMNECLLCRLKFIGNKHRVLCRECVFGPHPAF